MDQQSGDFLKRSDLEPLLRHLYGLSAHEVQITVLREDGGSDILTIPVSLITHKTDGAVVFGVTIARAILEPYALP